MRGSATSFSFGRRRGGVDRSNLPTVPTVAPVSCSDAGAGCDVTFARPVSLRGIPLVGATGGAHVGTEYPVSADVSDDGLIVTLTYAHVIANGDVLHFPFNDPAIRFANGAYVKFANVTVA